MKALRLAIGMAPLLALAAAVSPALADDMPTLRLKREPPPRHLRMRPRAAAAGAAAPAPAPTATPTGGAAPAASADPLPQALILTAIVIGFAVLAFSLALFHRGYQTFGSDDPDDLRVSDR